MVFNTLSWERSAPVEIDFPATDSNSYAVIDLASGEKLPSHRSGELSFIAGDLPGIGSRQYELVTRRRHPPTHSRIITDPAAKLIRAMPPCHRLPGPSSKAGITASARPTRGSRFSKRPRAGPAQFRRPALLPALRKRFQLQILHPHRRLGRRAAHRQESGLRRALLGLHRGDHFRTITFRLWNGLNRIDISVEIDLEALPKCEQTEEYGLAFALDAPGSGIRCETLGGLTALGDRLQRRRPPSSPSAGRSVRRRRERTLLLASTPDCHYLRPRHPEQRRHRHRQSGQQLSRIVEPRNEQNSGRLTFRFRLASTTARQADIAAFGWEAAAEPLVRRSWFTAPSGEYSSISRPRIHGSRSYRCARPAGRRPL